MFVYNRITMKNNRGSQAVQWRSGETSIGVFRVLLAAWRAHIMPCFSCERRVCGVVGSAADAHEIHAAN